jgi:hypothetical protein
VDDEVVSDVSVSEDEEPGATVRREQLDGAVVQLNKKKHF